MASPYVCIYHVMREEERPHFGSHAEVRGSYWTLEEANDAVREDLSEWDRDFFEEYEEDMEDGYATVEATCPEGETFSVYVVKKPAPGKQGREEEYGYVTVLSRFEDDVDEEGRSEVMNETIYESFEDAHAAALRNLLAECAVENTSDILEFHESRTGEVDSGGPSSDDRGYRARATLRRDDRFAVEVEVKKMRIQRRVADLTIGTSRKRSRGDTETEDDEDEDDRSSEEDSDDETPAGKRARQSSPVVIDLVSDSD